MYVAIQHTSTGNSPQEITKSEDTWYPLHHIGKSLKFDSIHWTLYW